jgi:hypothetical protein
MNDIHHHNIDKVHKTYQIRCELKILTKNEQQLTLKDIDMNPHTAHNRIGLMYNPKVSTFFQRLEKVMDLED